VNSKSPFRVIGVIPARMGSTRLPGKPLKVIAGRPLLEWVIRGARRSTLVERLMVATDDENIFKLAQSLDVEVKMTESQLASGSDRVWAAIKDEQDLRDTDIVVNIQGDEPLLTGIELDDLVRGFLPCNESQLTEITDCAKPNESIDMVTLGRAFKDRNEIENPNVAKIITDKNGRALYFSRLPIPYSRQGLPEKFDSMAKNLPCLKHVGLYGYTKKFLKKFCLNGVTPLEQAESLEQLRALWLGARIQVQLTDCDSWGVDTPDDVVRVESILAHSFSAQFEKQIVKRPGAI
jgi:3-deoxy-manno-octulosonate cytidylyltransferase (CMP-KDO synthetase)